MATQSEAALEQGLIRTLQNMSYEFVQIDEETNLHNNFKRQLEIHNQKALGQVSRTELTDKEFERVMIHLAGGTRFEKAKKLRNLFALDLDDGQRVWLEFLNTQKWCQNEFQVSNQITVEGRRKCRYDVTILINGLPLVQIELKRRGVELKEAYNQIQRYHKTSFHGLFDYIQIFVISNGVNTRYFANNPNQGYKFTFNWTDIKNHPFNDLGLFAAEFFDKCTLGKLISKYIVLHETDKYLMVLRPYQYYAVEKIIERVNNSTKNGYIWHTTGAGKTLTSFKAAQLVADLPEVDKVMFVVDRHDLDTQTQEEYEAFEKGAVDHTDDTSELIKRLNGNSKIIITTIQKLNAAVSKEHYSRQIEAMRDKRVIMIFDECHRSQFGESHKNIVKFFRNSQLFGFTGTPIFVENSIGKRTTSEIFHDCLHSYLIKDAIADENVLGFLVEYVTGNVAPETDAQETVRKTEIAKYILNNFDRSTLNGEFDALFAVSSVPELIQYYKIFKSLNPKINIGAVFTYGQNVSQDDNKTGDNDGFESNNVHADELQHIMDDYNATFDTQFSIDTFRGYYDDINRRLRKKHPDPRPLDLCIVVGMFLTGFDSKKLNTLYIDKNLEYHGLLQAFSRTNRVLNEKKRFGKIVCFRDLKDRVDESLRLFSNEEHTIPSGVIRPPYTEVRTAYNDAALALKAKCPTVQSVDSLRSEPDKLEFIKLFREIIKIHSEIKVYEEYTENDPEFVLSEQAYNDYLSKYLDIVMPVTPDPDEPQPDTPVVSEPQVPYGTEQTPDDIDFYLELLHSDVINVAYILALIADLEPSAEDYEAKRKNIIDTMIRDSEMRSKAHLIDGFIRKNVDEDAANFERQKADGTIDLESRLRNYISDERNAAIESLSQSEDIPLEVLDTYLREYDYLQKSKPEIIESALKEKHLGLLKTRRALKRIVAALTNIIKTFTWD